MTTITTNSTTGIVLTSPSYANPVVVDAGVTISNIGGNAISADTGTWTVQNGGSIATNTATVVGIGLGAGGAITNQTGGVA